MIKRYLKRPLPQNEAQLYEFTTEVMQACGVDGAEYRGIVAEMILHLDNRINKISTNELILMLKRRIANAVAYGHLMLAKEIAVKEASDAKETEFKQKAKEIQELSKVLDAGQDSGSNVLTIPGSGVNSQMGDSVS